MRRITIQLRGLLATCCTGTPTARQNATECNTTLARKGALRREQAVSGSSAKVPYA
jgi:hypothetical protein